MEKFIQKAIPLWIKDENTLYQYIRLLKAE